MKRGLADRRTQFVGEKIGGIVISDRTVGSAVDPSMISFVVEVGEEKLKSCADALVACPAGEEKSAR